MLQDHITPADVLSGGPDMTALTVGARHHNAFTCGLGILDPNDGVGARGHRCSRHDPDGGSGEHPLPRQAAGANRVPYLEGHRSGRRGPGHVAPPDREAVHGGIGEGRDVSCRAHVFAQYPTQPFVQRDPLARQRRHRVQDHVDGFVHRGHVHHHHPNVDDNQAGMKPSRGPGKKKARSRKIGPLKNPGGFLLSHGGTP